MSLEAKISELQKELDIKNAFLNVDIKFAKGIKLTKEAREHVVSTLLEQSTSLSSDQDLKSVDSTVGTFYFSDDQTNVLQKLANNLLKKSNKPEVKETPIATNQLSNTISQAIQNGTKVDKFRLMLLDNVDPTIRSKVDSGSVVILRDTKDNMAFVEDSKMQRFLVPFEDLEPMEE